MDPRTPEGRTIYQQIPQWFIAIVGLSYVTGYEIEFLYYASLGIVDAAGEIFKLKYILTGLVFIFPCALITIFGVALLGVARINVKRDLARRGFYATRWSIVSALFTFGSVYLLILFTPLHYFETGIHWEGVFVLVLLVISYSFIFTLFEKRFRNVYLSMRRQTHGRLSSSQIRELHRRFREDICLRDVTAMGLFALVLFVDMLIFNERRKTVLDLVISGGGVFLLLCPLIPVLLHRTMYRAGQLGAVQDSSRGFRYLSITGMSVSVLVLLLFLVLTSYSYLVFPFIPNLKGGGDYENAPKVSVTLRDAGKSKDPSGSLLLYTSSSSFYFAQPERGNDPCDWRVGRSRPEIIEFRREEIRTLSFRAESKQTGKTNCFWDRKVVPEKQDVNIIEE
jgi:hypothetical protein